MWALGSSMFAAFARNQAFSLHVLGPTLVPLVVLDVGKSLAQSKFQPSSLFVLQFIQVPCVPWDLDVVFFSAH